jgi:hypothetical protein
MASANRNSETTSNKTSWDSDSERGTIVHAPPKKSLRVWLTEDVDPQRASASMASFCFMTGFLFVMSASLPYVRLRFDVNRDAISVSASFVWCGFQTGNFIQVRCSRLSDSKPMLTSAQLAIALAALFEYPAAQRYLAFPKTLQLALCSLIAFMVTATAIGRVGDVLGTHKRYWLVFGSCLSALFTAVAAIAIWQSHSGDIASSRGNSAWTNLLTFVGIAFMSASVAVQCAQAKRLSTHFTTTST